MKKRGIENNLSGNTDSDLGPSLGVDILRHGTAKYKQQEVSLGEAKDLTERGTEEVRSSAMELVDIIRDDEEVEIWSSPMGRTLQTAKIVLETLRREGVRLRHGTGSMDGGLKVFEQLSEIKNFSWHLFNPLVVGGYVEFAGKNFYVDNRFTNPKNMNHAEYFSNDGIANIDLEVKKSLPPEYVLEIEGFERFADTTNRIVKILSRLERLRDKPYRVIIVTHDALAGFIANVFSGGMRQSINPGQFINLERVSGKLVATRVGSVS